MGRPKSKERAAKLTKRNYTELDDSNGSESAADDTQNPSLEDLAALIVQSKKEIQISITGKIESLQSHVDELKFAIDGKIDDVTNKCNTISQKVDEVEDEMKRMKKMNELRIAGIPYTQGEDLAAIFYKIANSLNIDLSNPVKMPFLYRIGSAQSQPIRAPIIAQFIATRVKSEFFSAYLKQLKLCLQDIGMGSSERIIITENLTKGNKQLFDEAYNLKKQSTIHQVLTIDGTVHIRIKKGNKPMSIGAIGDLYKLGLKPPPDDSSSKADSNERQPSPNSTPTVTEVVNQDAPKAMNEENN